MKNVEPHYSLLLRLGKLNGLPTTESQSASNVPARLAQLLLHEDHLTILLEHFESAAVQQNGHLSKMHYWQP
ncbi:hypothetical protein F3Y22_tig00000731pilonHSYRG00029 [Hibiscus syriacus]|uniref:Uncharacterized protein n=1 Tax=Hibiscus syriacus TaxID=106335 RepID=A0A6A3CZX1_HIBSY|nr:hypothetical protein F3Y22_tig00000731pilonHSYRG00029 [Hibiscus syriacus]